MSIHSATNKSNKTGQNTKPTFKRGPHNLSENINNSSFTIQQYNNFINIDSLKNNIHINNSTNDHSKPNTNEKSDPIDNNQHLQVPKPKSFPLKTSPSPMKKEIKAKKANYSTDRYIIDRPPSLNPHGNVKTNAKKDSLNLFKKLKGKISRNALDKQMGRSFENTRPQTTINSQSSKENLNSKISQLSKKFLTKPSDNQNFTNSFIHSKSKELQKNSENHELSQGLKKIDALLEGFLLKNEGNLQSENDILTTYITNLLQFMMEISEFDSNFSKLFKNLRYAIEVPISKMVEQFLRLRDFLIEQNDKLQENEKEIDYMKGQLSLLLKENDKMSKNQEMMNNFFSDRYEIDGFGLNSLQEIIKENSKLKNVLKKQKDSLTETRDKDGKIMKLLYAIRKKGIDIEEIYNEDVKTPEEISFMDENNINNKTNINQSNKNNQKYEEDQSSVIESIKDYDSGVRNDIYCDNSSSPLYF